jgi:hypothetical protein
VLLKPPGREGVAAPQVSAAPTRNALAAFHLQRAPIAARAWVTSVLEQVSTAWPRQPAPAIPATRGVRLHDLRHTFAVLQLSAGVHFMQVSKWLGHSTFTLTLDVYGDYIPEQDGGALSTLPEPCRTRRQGPALRTGYRSRSHRWLCPSRLGSTR